MRHLFLEGDIGCGKTSILLKNLTPYLPHSKGFMTLRLLDDQKNVRAYSIVPAAARVSSYEKFTSNDPNIFLEKTTTGWKRNEEVFTKVGLPMITDSEAASFFLLDEIGGFELLQPKFFNRLLEMLSSDKPCIGVIKSFKNLKTMCGRIGINDEYTKIFSLFHNEITKNQQVKTVNMSDVSYVEVELALHDFTNNIKF